VELALDNLSARGAGLLSASLDKKLARVFSTTPLILPKTGLARERFDRWIRTHGIKHEIAAETAGNEAVLALARPDSDSGSFPVLSSKTALSRGSRSLQRWTRFRRLRYWLRPEIGDDGNRRGPQTQVRNRGTRPRNLSGGSKMTRCAWVNPDNELYVHYHDEQWGVPVHDDALLFEMLILEGAQAGLSWETILKKRENYRAAYRGFDR
jgi:hypothetical protein